MNNEKILSRCRVQECQLIIPTRAKNSLIDYLTEVHAILHDALEAGPLQNKVNNLKIQMEQHAQQVTQLTKQMTQLTQQTT